jgi:hypothetical protein
LRLAEQAASAPTYAERRELQQAAVHAWQAARHLAARPYLRSRTLRATPHMNNPTGEVRSDNVIDAVFVLDTADEH